VTSPMSACSRTSPSVLIAGCHAFAGTSVMDLLIQPQPDGVAHPSLPAGRHERVGGAGAVGADQHLGTTRNAGRGTGMLGELRQRQVERDEAISGGVAAGVPGAKDRGEGLPAGDVGAVQEHQQRVEPQTVLVGRGSAFLLCARSADSHRRPVTTPDPSLRSGPPRAAQTLARACARARAERRPSSWLVATRSKTR